MRRLRTALPLLLVLAYVLVGVLPAWHKVRDAGHGRDYATYHYAVQEAVDGGDPYDTAALGRRARAEHTRGGVHPYFYPPPFLLGMLWAVPLSLQTAYRAWFWLNQLFLVGVFAVLWRWIKPTPLVLGAVLLSFTPIPDNAKMGQANLAVLLLVVLGLWLADRPAARARGSGGLLVGAAAMAKMSPALYLVGWLAQRRWRPVAGAVLAAIGLSLLALPLVGLSTQWDFYTQIMPGFASGDYHGLSVPITLPANHSIPDLFNQLWPGPDAHSLDPLAQRAASVVSLVLLGAIAFLGRHARDPLARANTAGALTVLAVITPVYTYEHHLVMLIFPLIAVLAALQRGRLGRGWWWVVIPAWFFVAWPLYWLRPAQHALPALAWWFQESKFFGAVALMAAGAWAGRGAGLDG